uniref:Uncharacterized protein n=1 Tax=Setaria italica TaxID=4555 RepID=K3YF89_SETIT
MRIIVRMLANKHRKLFHFLLSENHVDYNDHLSRTGTTTTLQIIHAEGLDKQSRWLGGYGHR